MEFSPNTSKLLPVTASFPPPAPPLRSLLAEHADDNALTRRNRERHTSLPAVNKAPGIVDRRKSARCKNIYSERASIGGQITTKSAKTSRARIPIATAPAPTLPSLPVLARTSVSTPTTMSSPDEEAVSPPDTAVSDSFEDAQEKSSNSPPETPTDEVPLDEKSLDEVPLKEEEGEESQSLPAPIEESSQLEEKEPSPVEEEESSPPEENEPPPVEENDKPPVEESEPPPVDENDPPLSVEKEPSPPEEKEPSPDNGDDATSIKAIHSRANTQDNIPVMLPPDHTRSRSVSPSKTIELRDEEGKRASVVSASTLQSASRTGSPSPTRVATRAQSPPKLHRGLSNESAASASRPNATRSTSSKFGGFLSRMGSMRKPAKSPPAPGQERSIFDRRNTSQSISSLASNGEHLPTIEDGSEEFSTGKRPSLQAQFLTLRKQGQDFLTLNGATLSDDEKDINGQAAHLADSSLEIAITPPPLTPALKSPLPDLNLPPGTASGLTAGPAEEPRPVDWDLWQAVVCEGPAAVARSSGEELNRAIASGIPAAIRGVVWQVLADSKSPELEDLYRTLRDRSVADIEQQQPPSRQDSQVHFHHATDSEREPEVASSSASIRSEKSAPGTSPKIPQMSPPPSVLPEDPDYRAKILAEKTRRDAAALSKLEKAIKRDLGSRTSFSKYTQAAGLQDGLFGLCKAYALFDEAVGYAQGINFIAMPLLFNASEEEAFTLLVRLMSKYDVRNMFTGDMAGLHLRLYQFERLLEDHDPTLYCHLRRRNVAPALYATQWFLTLFAYRFPLQLVLRVYDLIFSQGLIAILKFGLVLLEHNRDALLDMKDMGQLTNFLKEKLFDVYIDKSPSASSLLEGGFFGSVSGGADKELYRADEMVRDACAVDISESILATYTAEWEEQRRKDAEVETLRTSNIALTARIKSLEERTQQQDVEHVTIASDLVRVKVENDNLLDENEGLKMKVEELQRLVDTQPAEIEAKFQQEMELVLQRNSEVQSENRVLKEEQEEMERQMVDVKMRHAQTLQDHETLVQRWASVQAMFK